MEASSPLRRPWVLCGVMLVLLVTLVRLILNFRHDLPPATDGAYYPMQTWWLLTHGRLMYDDLPLFFWLNAALAKLIVTLSGLPLDDAAVLVSRLMDCTAQPLVAIFILILGYTWSAGRREAILGSGAAAVLAVFSPAILRMASDFQKNSLGLVWMVCALWAMRWALAEPRKIGRWVLLALVMTLAGLTHIGAFGVTCVMLMTAALVYCLAGGGALLTKRKMAWLVVGAGIGSAMLVMVWWFEPTRTVSLLTAPWRLVNVSNFRPSPAILLVVIAYGLLGYYTRWLWRNRTTIQRCDRAVIWGAAAAIAVMVFPFFPQDYVQRFMLMTPVPAAMLIAYLLAHRTKAELSPKPAKIFAVVVALLALASPWAMQGPTISADEADQIESLNEVISEPTHTLVVASHGLQYWAGLLLHTPVRMGQVPDDAFTRYGRVLMLEQTASSRRQPPGRDRRRPNSPNTSNSQNPFEAGPPGESRDPQAPPGQHRVVIPSNALLIRQTSSFKLYEIKGPVTGTVNRSATHE